MNTPNPAPPAPREPWTYDDIPLCNCGGCRMELLGYIPADREAEVKKIANDRRGAVPKRTVHRRVTVGLREVPMCKFCHRIDKKPERLSRD